MPSWLMWILIGLALGLIAAGINFFIMLQALKRMEKRPAKANGILGICYIIRFAVSLGTLLLAYFCIAKNIPFLGGVAFGLTIPNYLYFFYFREEQNFERKE